MKNDENKIKSFMDNLSTKRREKEKNSKKSEYIGAIVVNVILLYIFNNILNWQVNFITNAFNEVLWVINLAIMATIIGNIMFLIFNPEWFRHIIKMILNIFAFTAIYSIYSVFPFNFSSFLIDWSVTIALIFIMVGIAVATIIELFFLIINILARFKLINE
ncbi:MULTISPECIES: hypothetical protein [Methanobacterium]|uniref:Uncharacterized protein n=1 Tax=Methanobacterium veterum TaxID=408577 RepID=A0A9E5DN38_9EURY|nr:MULTISPECIES: hypothetical protein [Methanobacterium]MCZ3367390.1 hypothetical protein [Methanobacterium veterum]MCZ3373462.1 hypothetical protein [Methanobacterium veterum]